MKAFLKKSSPILISIGGTFAAAMVPALQAAVANHKLTSAAVAAALMFLHSALPSIFKN